MFVISSSAVLFLLLLKILLTELEIVQISLSLMLRQLFMALVQEEGIGDRTLSLTLF